MNEKWKNEKELTHHSARRQDEQGNNPVRDYRLVEKGIIPPRSACRQVCDHYIFVYKLNDCAGISIFTGLLKSKVILLFAGAAKPEASKLPVKAASLPAM